MLRNEEPHNTSQGIRGADSASWQQHGLMNAATREENEMMMEREHVTRDMPQVGWWRVRAKGL